MSMELIKAAGKGDVTTINALLNPNYGNNSLLIAAGRYPDVNFQEPWFGGTALHQALQGKHFAAAEMLIYYGASKDIVNDRGLTPIQAYHEFYSTDNIEQAFYPQDQSYDTQPLGESGLYDGYDDYNEYCLNNF